MAGNHDHIGGRTMRTFLTMIIACLFFAAPLLAEPPKAPESASISHLTSQAQKIKLGYTKESEVMQLLGQPASVYNKTKWSSQGSKEVKILKYGAEKNIIIRITDGVVTRVDMP